MMESARTATAVSEAKQHDDASTAFLPNAQLGMQTLTSALGPPSGADSAGF